MADPFIGEVRIFGFSYAPREWAFCDGALMQVSQNTALFSVLSDRFGGDGRTTFGLPNLQDRAVMGVGQGPGLSPRVWGESGGTQGVSLSEEQIPSHDHILMGDQDSSTLESPEGAYPAKLGGTRSYAEDTTFPKTNMSSSALAPAGLSSPHDNQQPFLAMNFCIALDGVYPPRS